MQEGSKSKNSSGLKCPQNHQPEHISVALQCSYYMRSLKIWATSCVNTYPEKNNFLLTCGATMQHSFSFSMHELKQRLQTCHTKFAGIPACSSPQKPSITSRALHPDQHESEVQ